MRGSRKKALQAALGMPPDRAVKRAWTARHRDNPKPIDGHIAGGWVMPQKRHHPLRAINKFFHELSDKGKGMALNLKFGSARKKGSFASLTLYPRGKPGTGAASRLSRVELLARIRALKGQIGVQGYVHV